MSDIKKIAVFGSGVMGAAIAAQCANAGYEVLLYDIVPKDADDRSIIAKTAIEKLLTTRPAPLMHPSFAERITPANIDDDMGLLSDVDWAIEAIIERLDLKQSLYQKIDANRKPNTIISSNTSTIPLTLLVDGMSEGFKEHFLITHFFNPPRYMQLLELIKGEHTSADVIKRITGFCDRELGKGVVDCHDRPGFIANRIGIFWIWYAIIEAMERGITVEEADALLGKPIGVPGTAVFGLADLIGIDLFPHIAKSMLETLDGSDEYHQINWQIPLINKMIEDGYTGRKGKGGFFVMEKTPEGKKLMTVKNLSSGEYAPQSKPAIPVLENRKAGLKELVECGDKYGDYVWAVMGRVLSYAASLVPEIADDIHAVDSAMRMGFGWKFGPFEMIDQIGAANMVSRLKADGKDVPEFLAKVGSGKFFDIKDSKPHYFDVSGAYKPIKRPEGVIMLSDIKLASSRVDGNDAASLWNVGDGVLCIEFTTKMNAMEPAVFDVYAMATKLINDGKFKALVIYNDNGRAFSAGANLGMFITYLNNGENDKVEKMITDGQATYKGLKYAPFPVVAAPTGLCLGGGCEILLHVDSVQAHAETNMGLVEVGVGLIPGWGGCKEMLLRFKNSNPTAKAFKVISSAKTSASAADAFAIGYLREGTDGVVMNKDRLLERAKAKALELLAGGYTPPKADEAAVTLSGAPAKAELDEGVKTSHGEGKATDYDVVVLDHLATILSGGAGGGVVSEDELYTLECEEFMKLCNEQGSRDRIQHMLDTGKPLRN